MCLPALGLIGGLVSAIGSVVAGAAQAQASQAQAAAHQRQAEAERAQAAYNAERQREKSIKMLSEQRAGFLGGGFDVTSGTPLDVMIDTTRESELDVSAIKYNGEIKAQNFEMQASAERAKGNSAMIGGVVGGISPLVKGFGGGTSTDFMPTGGYGGTNVMDG